MYLIFFVAFIGLASATYRSDSYRSNSYSSGNPSDVCLQVPTLGDFGLEAILRNGRVFRNVVDDTEDNQKVDNICITTFPLPSNPDIWTMYISIVYEDKSNAVYTFLATNIAAGTIQRADPDNVEILYFFDETCCNTNLTYICRLYSSSEISPTFSTVTGLTTNYKPLPISCLEKIKERLAYYELPDGVIALPLSLPPRCITQPACVPSIPFYKRVPLFSPL